MYQAEVKKLTHFAPLWIYLIMCLLLNVIIIFNNGHVDYFNDISSVAKVSGQKMDESVYAKLKGVPESNAKEDVLYIADHVQPLYQNYDVDSELTEYYMNIFSLTPQAIRIIERKYESLQDRVDHLAEIKADMDLYAGPMTDQSYKNLFYTLLKAISGESCIIAMLLTVYLLGYERNAKTDQYFNSTKTGRKETLSLQTDRFSAGLDFSIPAVDCTVAEYLFSTLGLFRNMGCECFQPVSYST